MSYEDVDDSQLHQESVLADGGYTGSERNTEYKLVESVFHT